MSRKSLFLLNLSFNCDQLSLDTSREKIPYLIFDYTITTNQFHTSNYGKPLSKDRIRLHKEIMKLHDIGWGYTKIHRYLVQNGFEIGKSRTTVHSIIRRIKKRDEFFSQPILDGIGNFRVKML